MMMKMIQKMVDTHIAPVRAQCDQVENRVNEHDGVVAQLQEQLNGHQEQLNGHQEQLNGHQEQLNGHQEQLNGHQEQLNSCQEQLNGYQEQLNSCQEQLNGHQEQLNRHQQLLDECMLQVKRAWQAISATDTGEHKTPVRFAMMPYHSIEVEGITYLYHRDDEEIPNCMDRTGMNYSKYDIDNFLSVADDQGYKSIVPETGIFLDIGGNIGTTTIYCKIKKKPNLDYIAFEPVEQNAKLFEANCVMNGCHSVHIEKLALSNYRRSNVVMEVSTKNSGASKLLLSDDSSGDHMEQGIETITLDEYLAMHNIQRENVRYIWLDVEGHETEVLEGAKEFFSDYSVPTCMEYNQDIYYEKGVYETMVNLLQKYFNFFVVCSQYAQGNKAPRCVSELPLLWEELQHEPCDLILWK